MNESRNPSNWSFSLHIWLLATMTGYTLFPLSNSSLSWGWSLVRVVIVVLCCLSCSCSQWVRLAEHIVHHINRSLFFRQLVKTWCNCNLLVLLTMIVLDVRWFALATASTCISRNRILFLSIEIGIIVLMSAILSSTGYHSRRWLLYLRYRCRWNVESAACRG